MNDRVTRSLMVTLSRDEVSTYAKELARVTAKQAELEDEKKAVTSDFKGRIDRCTADCQTLAGRVTTGRELRDIDCEWSPTDGERMELTRMDTGEAIDTRKMTEEEHQQSLPLAEAEKGKKK